MIDQRNQHKDFALSVQSSNIDVPYEGPIALFVSISYQRENEITILHDAHEDVSFEAPRGWELKKPPELRHLQGRLPTVTLSKGQSISYVVYVHDYFDSIAPGKVDLPITVSLWPEGAQDISEAVVLRAACTLNVLAPNPEDFRRRIAEIAGQIASERSGDQRMELYRSVASLSHPDLVPIFLESLLDSHMLIFHFTARKRLVELAEKYEQRCLIIRHLASHGSRYDAQFFDLWRAKQVRLSQQEIMQLCEASSLWIRLLCLENYEDQYNRQGLIASLKSELDELNERVRTLTHAQ